MLTATEKLPDTVIWRLEQAAIHTWGNPFSCRTWRSTCHLVQDHPRCRRRPLPFRRGRRALPRWPNEMNNYSVQESLNLMNPSLGKNVIFGPDVVVEANVRYRCRSHDRLPTAISTVRHTQAV